MRAQNPIVDDGDIMKNACLVAASMLAIAGVTPANAAVLIRAVDIKNASFEKDRYADGEFAISGITDWTVSGSSASAGAMNPTAAMLPSVPDGQNVGLLNSYLYNGFEERSGSLTQALAETVATGTLYTMTVDVGRRLDVASAGSWVAEILAGSTVVASGSLSDAQIASGSFTPLSITYTGDAATAGTALGVRFRSIFDPTSRQQTNQVNIDNVRMTAAGDDLVSAVPEPATWMMMIGGFAAVGASLRRRRVCMPMSTI